MTQTQIRMSSCRAAFFAVILLVPWCSFAEPPADSHVNTNASSGSLIESLEKMLRGGLPPAVLTTFIEHWSVPYLTTTEDLRRLQKLGANSAVITAFCRRGAELRLRARQQGSPGASSNAPPQVILAPVPVIPQMSDLWPTELARPEAFPSSETIRNWAGFNPLFHPWWPGGHWP